MTKKEYLTIVERAGSFATWVYSLAGRTLMILVLSGYLSACSFGDPAGGPEQRSTATSTPAATATAGQDEPRRVEPASEPVQTKPAPTIAPTPTTTPQPTATRTAEPTTTQTNKSNNPVREIPLSGPIADRQAELSGLAWYGDQLILLPQYPDFDANETGSFLYALAKADILAFLDGRQDQPLTPRPVPFVASGVDDSIPGFEGYEAVAFSGDDAYFTIEARTDGDMLGYLVKGKMAPEALTLDTSALAVISPQTDAINISEESLFVTDQVVGVIYELNGLKVNPAPVIHLFDLDLTPTGTIPLPNVPFRITDVTMLDTGGRFWAINYFYPGSDELLDLLGGQEGQASGDQSWPPWEGMGRLLELQFSPSEVTPAGTVPIQLETNLSDVHNWEGLARLDDRGFLLVSDEIPGTVLGFVPIPADG